MKMVRVPAFLPNKDCTHGPYLGTHGIFSDVTGDGRADAAPGRREEAGADGTHARTRP